MGTQDEVLRSSGLGNNTWHWSLHGCKQLTNGQIKKCGPGAGQIGFRDNQDSKNNNKKHLTHHV